MQGHEPRQGALKSLMNIRSVFVEVGEVVFAASDVRHGAGYKISAKLKFTGEV